jgi:zinc protease
MPHTPPSKPWHKSLLLIGLAGLLLLSALGASAQPSQFQLANGMTVIVQPDRRAPTAVHMLWVRVGSIDEVDGTSGVAHVLEHMMFKGTDTLGAGEFSKRVAQLGGRENAFTARDYTGYFQQIPANRLEEVMRLEADRFANNRWPDEAFRSELEVVKEERRSRVEDSPRARLWELLSANAFVASGYRRPIIGWMGDLDSLQPDDVRQFHRQWYAPSNAAVVVVGDVDVQQVRQWAERHYGPIPAKALPERKPRPEPAQQGLRRVEIKAPAEQAYLALAWRVPSWSPKPAAGAATRASVGAAVGATDDALALTVLAAVLSGYEGARLDRALMQGPNRVADSASAGNGLWGRGPQQFVLSGVPAPGKTVEQLEQALRGEVARIAQEGVSEAELRRVKAQWVAAEVYKRDALMSQARELGSLWALDLPLDASDQLIAALRGVTAAQVQSVAQRYFAEDQLTVGVLRPQPPDGAAPRRPPIPGARH